MQENELSKNRIEERNSDASDLDEEDGNSQLSGDRGGGCDEDEDVLDAIGESKAKIDDQARISESQSPAESLGENVHDGDRALEPNPSQVAAANIDFLAATNSSNNESPSVICYAETLDATNEVEKEIDNLVEKSEILPMAEIAIFGKSPKIAQEPSLAISVDANAVETRDLQAHMPRAEREDQRKAVAEKLSSVGGPVERNGSIANWQLLKPGLVTLAKTENEEENYDGVSMALSPVIERTIINENGGEKVGWRNDDDYVLGIATRSDSNLRKLESFSFRIACQHESVSGQPDPRRSSSKSSESDLVSSGRFVSAVVIDEESLQLEFENKMKAGSASAEEIETFDKRGFFQKNALQCSCMSLVIIVGLVIALFVGMGQAASLNATKITNDPTLNPTLLDDDQYLELLFSSISGNEVIRDPNTPQAKAMETIFRESKFGVFDMRTVGDQYLSERYALRVLYYSTKGDSWLITDHNFHSMLYTCDWMNATQGNRLLCNDVGEVTDLFLNFAGLNGTIPSEMGVISSLSQLSLAKNSLIGTIPGSLGELKDMKFMQFALNSLSGTIPSSFERFTKLERFIMHVNHLSGTLPNIWGDKFRRLRINDNQLTGTIPEMPTRMALEWFQVSDNAFTGTLPLNLAAQPKLITLATSNNRFEGTITNEFGELTLLENFVVDGNLLYGTLPSILGRLKEIDWFWVHGNNFTGSLPASFEAMTKATQLKFHNNNFNGILPNEWSALESLVSLDVSNNPNLEGAVPSSFIGLEALTSFALSGTGISGGLADTFCATQQPLDLLSAECGGATPFIECPCCTSCCDDNSCA